MEILLETERLRLRRFTEADADHLFALDNDPEVMRYLNGGMPTPRAVVETEILPGFMQPTRPLAFGRPFPRHLVNLWAGLVYGRCPITLWKRLSATD